MDARRSLEGVGSPPRGLADSWLPLDAGRNLRPATRQAADAPPLRVLVVDADRAMLESCTRVLEADGYHVTVTRRGDEAVQLLARQAFDVVLADLQVPGLSGLAFLREVHGKRPEALVIATSGRASVRSGIEAIEGGAWEYVPKPFSATHLQVLIGRAAHGVAARRQSERPRDDHAGTGDVPLLGTSLAIRKAIALARRVAQTDASVFLTGESGTGKERLAQFIHARSRRRDRPMIAINCAAIPESLLETELFGHCRGAFTGAVADKQGLLEAAHGGTFFLDELSQMPLGIQVKLLRVLQDGVLRRLGSDSVSAIVDVRFIAATNQLPEESLRAGGLREDLYYRLRVFPIHLPPLRERREDIPILAEHFLRRFWTRHRQGTPPRLSDAAMRALLDHPWRGNVRELQNLLEYGVVLFEPGMVIQAHDIPFDVHAEEMHAEARHEPGPGTGPLSFLDDPEQTGYLTIREQVLTEFERRYLMWLVRRSDGNLARAARIAGVQRTTIYRLMAKHGLQREITMPPSLAPRQLPPPPRLGDGGTPQRTP